MKVIPYDEPGSFRKFLTEVEWGYQTADGRVTAHFCPLCHAMVPAQGDASFSPRTAHIEFHAGQAKYMAQHLQKITELEAQVARLKRGPQLYAAGS